MEQIINIEIAGVPAAVRCRHEENLLFLADYRTEKETVCTIDPSGADLEKIRNDLAAEDEKAGLPQNRYTKRFVERNAIHALLAEKLTEYGVLLFHGSALSIDGEAVVFTAPSGTGKSTQARLWREVFGKRVQMINDDKPLLRLEDGRVRAYGSPWNGKHHLSANISAPLKAIIEVKRSAENRIERITRADAFQVLMRQGYQSDDPVTAARLIGLKNELSEKVPFYRLFCTQEKEAAHVAREGISRV